MPETLKATLSALLDRFGGDWASFKHFAEHAAGISHDSMHVIAGVVLQLLFAAGLRRTLASPLPFAMVLAIELANEWNDYRVEHWPSLAMQMGEAAKDIGLTMALPALLLLLARFRPRLLA